MLFPDNIIEKLGFNQIVQGILNLCKTDDGKLFASRIHFKKDFRKVQGLLNQLSDLIRLKSEGIPPVQSLESIETILKYVSKPGSQLDGEDFVLLGRTFQMAEDWNEFLKQVDSEEYPELVKIIYGVSFSKGNADVIFSIVDENGEVRDSASPELGRIRREKESQFRASRKITQRIFNELKKSGYVPDASSVSVNNGRTVIPVFSEHKRHVSGYIQGASATGQTVYIEPSELIETSNQIQELEAMERREVVRILTELTSRFHNKYEELLQLPTFIGKIDLIVAKANYSITNGYNIPKLNNSQGFKWVEAYHPILKASHDKEGKVTKSVSVSISSDNRILVISGPNAGGKSVTLKTVGLLQLMIQSGIPVPVDESSIFGVFDDVFIDIGDDQSIENDLSTYSSHLYKMSKVLSRANEKSLILFDEFGSGTEPALGGAIAQSILEELVNSNCRGIITTHYQNIKELSETTQGLFNGAMRFDTDKMEPLYELIIGRPGQSFALEIARKTGLGENIIKRASELAGKEIVELDELLAKTEQQKIELEKRTSSLAVLEKKVNDQKRIYDEKLAKLEKEKKEILRNAAEQASYMISSANKEIEKTIRHIKTSKANKAETQKVRNKLTGVKERIDKTADEKKPVEEKVLKKTIEKGDRVRLPGQSGSGIVQSIKGNNSEILFGQVTVRAKIAQLEVLEKGKDTSSNNQFKKQAPANSLSITQKKSMFRSELNIRGMRAEEAISELERFIDEALLAGVNEIRVLHGKGEGVLRTITRDVLKKYSFVESFHDEHADRGGAGITIIHLK